MYGRKRPDISKNNKKGKLSWGWKGGRRYYHDYIIVYFPEHPNSDKSGYVSEHRLIMEKHLGRYLNKTEIVHHLDGNKHNNKLKNLILFDSNSKHHKFHRRAYEFLVEKKLISNYQK